MEGQPADRLQAALVGRYRVERVLGAGGMATVYLAEDLKHRRPVAVKVLKPELAAAIGTERFLREIAIVSGFSHPHILPLYDSGESRDPSDSAGGRLLFYVMPFIDGETLRDRLRREKQLPVDEAVHITRQVAGAVAYALDRGIVHRDLKPENILLTGGDALVADFGIAQAISTTDELRLTGTGVILGTPPYMSPEQVLGEQDLDGRSDVYALGCILYELLAGEPPYVGPTAQAIVTKHLTEPVPEVRRLRSLVPAHVSQAISRALAKSRADRFATPRQFAEALVRTESGSGSAVVAPATPAAARRGRRAAVTVASVALVLAVLIALDAGGVRDTLARRLSGSPVERDDRRSVAVLPFDNVGRKPEEEYFSDGLTEELIVALSQVRDLRVAARTSAFAFKGQARDVREVARILGVATVLVGSVRMAPGRVRVTTQLIDASTGLDLWSQTYDERALSDIFDIQSDVALRIAGALEANLTPTERGRLTRRPTENIEAYTLYLKGRFFWNRRGEGLRTAIDYFTRALQVDSQYARAWAGLASAYAPLGVHGYIRPREGREGMRQAALQAVALDPELAEAHTALAGYLHVYEWNWEAAEREYIRAIELDPNYHTARLWYGYFLEAMGRFDESLVQRRRMVELDPLMPSVGLGTVLNLMGRGEEALEFYRDVIERDSAYWQADEAMSDVYEGGGKLDEAARALERAVAHAGNTSRPKAHLARVLARAGNRVEARRLLEELRAQARASDIYHPVVATALAAAGDVDGAFAWLEKSYAQRHPDLNHLSVEGAYRALRGDPRFTDLLRRVGLRGS